MFDEFFSSVIYDWRASWSPNDGAGGGEGRVRRIEIEGEASL